MDWFRWHHGSVNDPKFQLVAKRARASVAEVIAVWATVLEAASASQERGVTGGIDCEAVDCALGMDDGKTAAILSAMGDRGLLGDGGEVKSWEKRQPRREREDDTSTERKRRQRERQVQEKQGLANAGDHVTPCHTTSHQKTPRGEEIREEEIRASVANATGESPPADPIWGTGLAFLIRKGIPQKQARELIGKLRKATGDVRTGAVLADCEAQDITNPAPWLMAAAARAGPATKVSASADFRNKTYTGTPIHELPLELQ